jgi:hypothetical protein
MSINCQAKIQLSGLPSDRFGNTKGNIFISAGGYVTPCGWMGAPIRLHEIWEQSKIDKKTHNLAYYTLAEIIDGPMFKWIDNNQDDIGLCNWKCGESLGYDKVISVDNV